MLSLTRHVPRRVTLPMTRSLAEVVSTKSKTIASVSGLPTKKQKPILQEKVPVREDHGLWAFFRRKPDVSLVGEERYEVIEHPFTLDRSRTGRAWKASELRLKSFEDLHTLWYIILRERNLLATQKEETRRMGVIDPQIQVSAARVHQCRKTMARIKAVLNERRLAYAGALKLIEEEKHKEQDELVWQYQLQRHAEERKLVSRRKLTERRKEAQQRRDAELLEKREVDAGAQYAEQIQASDTVVLGDTTPNQSTDTFSSAETTEEEEKPQKKIEKVEQVVQRKTPVNPADAAVDGLFGAVTQNTGGRRSS
ncbi:hypothetical protein AMATHDRAFT_53887 [Amanita thiersii Skay4041]|uniref:Large ribosomal subunit protein uL29m n=1 Tax=Amanita thiersii Skay4041 TaxID=703135 RepID=A0A2A9NVD7_9AGAR|nr:hypothetical protein AMATHDRAFT_53887 [Amanita thiersii Skay4041]